MDCLLSLGIYPFSSYVRVFICVCMANSDTVFTLNCAWHLIKPLNSAIIWPDSDSAIAFFVVPVLV